MNPNRILIGFSMAVLISVGTVCAQVERGTIAGTVRDPSEVVVPDVTLTVKNVATGVEFKTTTNQGERVRGPQPDSVRIFHYGYEAGVQHPGSRRDCTARLWQVGGRSLPRSASEF